MGADQGLTHLFYDGDCRFCQGAAGFVARHDRARSVRFAPLRGETFNRLLAPADRDGLPDSLVVRTPSGALLVRTAAVLHLLGRMGPAGRRGGRLLGWIPRGLRDAAYDWLARHRPSARACSREAPLRDDRYDT